MTMPRTARLVVVLALAAVTPATAVAHEGWGIAVDASGRVYVTDIPTNTIWRISLDGRVEPVHRHVHSHALSVGPAGDLFGTDVHLTQPVRGVWRLDASGRLSDVVPATRGFPLDLQSFLRGADGAIYSASVSQYPEPVAGRTLYLLRWSPGGAIDTIAGGPIGHADGLGSKVRFESIDGMAWLPDGTIVLADGPWLRQVSGDGHVVTLGEKLTQRRWDQDLMGVAVGPDGAVYAADFSRRVVHRRKGDRVEPLYRANGYWAPTGVAATSDGVYILEHPRAPLGVLGDLRIGPYLRVRRLDTAGGAVVLMTQWGEYSSHVGATLVLVGGMVTFLWMRRRRKRSAAVAFATRSELT